MKKALFFGALFLSAAASAAPPSAPAPGSGGSYDPNQLICRSQADTGSRLGHTRVCLTRAQWEDRRRETRTNMDRSQINSRNDGN